MIEPMALRRERRRRRNGVALVAVLYFLVVCALVVAALFFVQRSMARGARSTTAGAQLLGAAQSAVYDALAQWDGATRARQVVGTTTHATRFEGATSIDVYVTRLSMRVFSLIAQARTSEGIARRVELLVRVPFGRHGVGRGLTSAVNVSIGGGVRFLADTGLCAGGDSAVTLAPGATLSVDPVIPPSDRPTARIDSAASDSATYLRLADAWWSDLARAADVQLVSDAHVTPSPVVVAGSCASVPANWGEPVDRSSACATRVPVIFAPGDLTIDGGVGQGVLLVGGHLVIAGAFTFSGQIVVRGGMETRADNIAISGTVAAWRERVDPTAPAAASNEVMLTHATTVRYSRCDADHGVASWLQPRRVRDRAFAELF